MNVLISFTVKCTYHRNPNLEVIFDKYTYQLQQPIFDKKKKPPDVCQIKSIKDQSFKRLVHLMFNNGIRLFFMSQYNFSSPSAIFFQSYFYHLQIKSSKQLQNFFDPINALFILTKIQKPCLNFNTCVRQRSHSF